MYRVTTQTTPLLSPHEHCPPYHPTATCSSSILICIGFLFSVVAFLAGEELFDRIEVILRRSTLIVEQVHRGLEEAAAPVGQGDRDQTEHHRDQKLAARFPHLLRPTRQIGEEIGRRVRVGEPEQHGDQADLAQDDEESGQTLGAIVEACEEAMIRV